jgi:hypothetical protein
MMTQATKMMHRVFETGNVTTGGNFSQDNGEIFIFIIIIDYTFYNYFYAVIRAELPYVAVNRVCFAGSAWTISKRRLMI